MDRIIKFRGFNEELNKWLYGSLIKMNREYSDKEFFILPAMRLVDFKHDAFCSLIKEVAPESVGQFTGLHDKNGKEIYEGDILKRTHATFGDSIVIVQWDTIQPAFVLFVAPYGRYDAESDWSKCGQCHYEVIGNTYENPELLEKTNA